MIGGLGVVVRFGLYLDLMVLFGAPLFALYNPCGEMAPEVRRALRRTYLVAAAAGLLLSGLAMIVLAASMAGVPVAEVDQSTMRLLITETAIGWAWLARVAALALLIVIASVANPARGFGPWLLVLLSGVALGSLAWTGHGAMDEGAIGLTHLVADIIHLFAAGAWIAAILAFGVAIIRAQRSKAWESLERTHAALSRFALVGTIAVALLVITGLINTWLLVGWSGLWSIGSSLYLQLLTLKLLLFFGMLGLAALHRYRSTPALETAMADGDPHGALGSIRRSIAVEAGLGLAILALVAWLGTLAPPATGM